MFIARPVDNVAHSFRSAMFIHSLLKYNELIEELADVFFLKPIFRISVIASGTHQTWHS
jgi:hypothetical protein